MKAFIATVASLIAAGNAQLIGYSNLGAHGLATPAFAPATYAAAPAFAPATYAAAPAIAVAPATYAAAPAVAVAPAVPSVATSQFHAQDELGQFQFGHTGPLGARQESRDAYGVVRGSYSSPDANGIIQITNYVSDLNGFRVAASNLPIAPEAPVVAPLVAPVFKAAPLEAPIMTLEQVADTEEVAEAKAKFFETYEAEKNREKRSVVPAATAPIAALPAAFPSTYGFPANYAYGFPGAYANYGAAYSTAFAPATYGAVPAIAPAAIAAPAPALAYNAAGPAAGAIPSVKTTIKLNPGHSTFYRIDPVA